MKKYLFCYSGFLGACHEFWTLKKIRKFVKANSMESGEYVIYKAIDDQIVRCDLRG